eukprot:7105907-Alexandrium_andersonii.AAC.1
MSASLVGSEMCIRDRFIALLDRFVFDEQDPGLLGLPNLPEVMFERVRNSDFLARKGSKLNFNRFMSAVKHGRDTEGQWTKTYFAYLLTCLEQDYLVGANFKKIIVKPQEE